LFVVDVKPREDRDKMLAEAARFRDLGRMPIAALVAALVGVSAGAVARANDLSDARRPVIRPGQPQTSTPSMRCARYGEGFVPVVGSDTCVKIGGRLRIDLGNSLAAPAFAGPRDGINPAAHVRVGR
jgi:hypothetical protein